MERTIEQRYAIKFCVRLGKTAIETLAWLKEAYGDDTLSRAQVCRWYSDFAKGRETVEDIQRSGRPSTSTTEQNVARVKNLLDQGGPAPSLRQIAENLNLPKSTVHKIVKERLSKKKGSSAAPKRGTKANSGGTVPQKVSPEGPKASKKPKRPRRK